ncbi:hypothetical protein [Desulfosporosinus sp. SB140]|uniref:hypothetical protein n=1 Tax=Desulfosporosinus paludis TaxID=3115649 RepID=UPI00388F5ED8
MGFIQLVLLEGLLLFSAGMIFFGGAWGTIAAMVVISGLNILIHPLEQFWRWEMPLLLGGILGVLLLLFIGKMAKQSNVVSGLVGGLIGLVLFGAFLTPMAAIVLWILVVGMGIIPKSQNKHILWSLAPTILRIMIGLGSIIFGNFMTF